MNKEEILEKSRHDYKKTDEVAEQAYAIAGKMSVSVGLVLCAAITLLRICITGEFCNEAWIVFTAMCSINLFVRHSKLHKKTDLIFAVISAVTCVLLLALFVYELMFNPMA